MDSQQIQDESLIIELKALQVQNNDLKNLLNGLSSRLDGMAKLMGTHTKEIDVLKNQTKEIINVKDMLTLINPLVSETASRLEKVEDKIRPQDKRVMLSNTSETIGKIAEALAKAKKEFKPIVPTGEKQGESKKYTIFDDLFTATVEALEKNNLTLDCMIDTNEDYEYCITMILSHSSGEFFRCRALLNESKVIGLAAKSLHQSIATAEQYLKKVMYRSMLCMPDKAGEE